MKKKVIITDGENKHDLVINVDTKIVIGRSSKADVKVDDAKVSGKHCEIYLNEVGEVMIKDLDTTNGTYVNSEQIEEAQIDQDDKVTIGKILIEVVNSEKTKTHATSVEEKMKRRILKKGKALNKKGVRAKEDHLGTGVFSGRKFELEEESGETKMIKLTRVIKNVVEKPRRKIQPREKTKMIDKVKNFFTKSKEEDEE